MENKGFRQTIKNLLPHMDYGTENPFRFTQRVWEHIYDDTEEIENVVKSVNKATELLRD